MERLIIKSRSKKSVKVNSQQRSSSHDFSEYLISKKKKDNICIPLKPKENVKSKFFKGNLKLKLPKLDEAKSILPKKYSSSSKLMVFSQKSEIVTEKNNSKPNLPFINISKQSVNNSYTREKRRRSISFLKPNNSSITSVKTKKMYLDKKILKEYHVSSLAGQNEFGETKTNQDSYLILTNINNYTNFNVFAVFDGHGEHGHFVSQFLVKYFTDFFKTNPLLTKCKDEIQIFNLLLTNDYKFLRDAVKNSEESLKKEEDIDSQNSGSTLCMVIQIYKKLICVNVGDSRAILSLSEILRDEIQKLSEDHKPYLKKEQERIKKCGGYVEKFIYEDGVKDDGPYRVWNGPSLQYPGLAISRSIGDTDATCIGVISEPDCILKSLKKEMNFIVIASDGIWEFLDNKKVVDVVKNFYSNGNAKDACEELVKKSREIWEERGKEIDDITAIVIFL